MSVVAIYALRTNFASDFLSHPLPITPSRQTELLKIKHLSARNRSLAAELLICWYVRKFQPKNIPSPPVRSYLPQGKPYVAENPDFHFSLSHSGDWATLAVSNHPVGVDVQLCDVAKPNIARRYFHAKEQDWLFSLPVAMQEKAFYQLWVLKESAVKALGTGMHLPFREFCVSTDPEKYIEGFPARAYTLLPHFDDPAYELGVCTLSSAISHCTHEKLTLQEVLS